ncbi:MAG: hypothetical protein AAFX65_00775 [Cyanobacteria bacterium J06638_7]
MPPACSALISLLDRGARRQRHWWLAAEGEPGRIAALLAAPLRGSDAPPRRFEEILRVFAPLPPLPPAAAGPAGQRAGYRYLIQLRRSGACVSCWRRHGGGIGWQRRCGPMGLGPFLRHFRATPGGAGGRWSAPADTPGATV